MQAMPSARPSAPKTFGPRRLHRHRTAQHRGQALHHGRGVGRQAGCIGHHGAVGVGAGEALAGGHGDDLGQQGDAVGAFPDGVGVGEVPSQVTQAHGSEHRVGQGVADGVGVAVATQAPGALDLDAAEHQRPMRVLGEAVDVDALADAHAHRARAASRSSAAPRSSGSVILRLPGFARNELHRAAHRLDQHGVVGGAEHRRPVVAPSQHPGPEGLRRLDGHQAGAVQGAGDPSGFVHGLDGVTRRHPRHGAVRSPVGHGRDHGLEQCGRGQGPRRVVDDDHGGIVGDGVEPATHRVGPRAFAGHDQVGAVQARAPRGRPPPPWPVPATPAPRRRNRAGTPARPIRAPGGRPARRVLLQPAEAAAGAPGHDDRPHRCHGAVGPWIRSGPRSGAPRPCPRPR